jgi:hypothetical protein
MASCKIQTVAVPIESVKTQYIDRYLRDSIYLSDSVYLHVFEKGDTIYKEKYRYKTLYKEKLVRDSVFVTDSIQVAYPVKGDTQYVNRLHWWQTLLMVLGAACLGMGMYKLYTTFRIG